MFRVTELISTNARTLQMVVGLQLLESGAQVLVIAAALLAGVDLPVFPLVMIVGAFAIWNLLSFRQAGQLPSAADSTNGVLLQLIVSVVVLTGLLYFTGGATSPFVSLFLVPIAIGAMALPFARSALVLLLAAIAYTLLLFYHVPLAAQHMHGDAGFNFHVTLMWVNFLASGVVLHGFLGMLAWVARERASALSALREKQLRSEQVMAVAGVAAGAAHSLATPLSTIAILLDEMEESGEFAAEVKLARAQLGVVRARLDEILCAARDDKEAEALHDLVNRLAHQWHITRPEADLRIQNQLSAAPAALDPALGHGLTTLLDNAADANTGRGASRVLLRCDVQQGQLHIEVEDEGGGPLPDGGAVFQTTKNGGHGAGLLILRTNLERLGGSLDFLRGRKGCVARLVMPLPEAST